MKIYLEFRDARSSKFWEVSVKGASFVVRYGKIGTTGQSKTKDFFTKAEAKKAAEKLADSKRKRGYAARLGKAAKAATKKKAAKAATKKMAAKAATKKKAAKAATKKTAAKAATKKAAKATTKKAAKATTKVKKTPTKTPKKSTQKDSQRFMTEKAEKAIRELGCWDSVTTKDVWPLGNVAWNRFSQKDPASTVAVFLHILSVPPPPKGEAQEVYLTTAKNACRFALKVDDDLALYVANHLALLAPNHPSIFQEVASTYARIGASEALGRLKLSAKNGLDVPPELVKRFAPNAPPEELVKLHPFDDLHSEEYSRCFALSLSGETCPWSKKREFKKRIIIFATTGSGTDYALWVQPGESLSQAPVVVFGGEGGTHVIADDLKALLRLLSVDCEVSVDSDEAYFYRGEDGDRSEYHREYKKWLESNFGLKAVSKPDTLTKKAQKKWGKKYAEWVTPLLE